MPKLDQKKILIVDDEEALRSILGYMLEEEGALVSEAAGGIEALAKLKTTVFDIVISDFKMPGGDGITLLKTVQTEIHPKPLFFMYTGFINDAKEDALAFGANEVFIKPFDMENIIPTIVKALS
jgi:CheY-like chemotaxis protein